MSTKDFWPDNRVKYDLNTIMREYTGTDGHYRNEYSLNLTYTQAIRDMARQWEAYWLILELATVQSKLPNELVLVLRLERTARDSGSFILTADDGNGNILSTTNIANSDFPFDSAKFYIENNVILLPSER